MKKGSSRAGYIESHSALRGIAATVVVLDHLRHHTFIPLKGLAGRLCQIFGWNDVAVFLFFILSGYVMGHVYPSQVNWKHFFVARLARLVPVYEVTLAVALVSGLIWFGPAFSSVPNTIANFLMIQAWLPGSWVSVNPPAWSLSVEAFLYLALFPSLVMIRPWTGRRALHFFLLGAGAVWGVIFYNYASSRLFLDWRLPLLTGIAGFGAGFSLQSLLKNERLRYPPAVAASGVILIVLGLLQKVIFPGMQGHGYLALGLVAIVAVSADPAGPVYHWLARPFFVYLGDISYSIYLWHYPLMLWLLFLDQRIESHLVSALAIDFCRICFLVGTVALCFSVATLSYYWLEVPFRRIIRDRFVRARPGAVLAPAP